MAEEYETQTETALVTLAALRRSETGEATEVLFNERHRIYTLPQEESAEKSLGLLREILGSRRPIRVSLDPLAGVVRDVSMPADEQIKAFEEETTFLEDPQETFSIDLEEIDPTEFNLVEHFLDIPVFRLCEEIIPNYKKAKEIFDFCAAQSCHLGGPFSIAPCIPFQYVIDGCYARAHKMRRIITERFGYCCEKVFSYATDSPDRLAVQANKWGGCCVTWWYHVAPLVRVRVTLGNFSIVLALVIDPGMFDKPVLLTSWLYAQENRNCNANANVTSYSIQPGSAYTPSFPFGTYTTDPNYVSTDATLNNYQNRVTCP